MSAPASDVARARVEAETRLWAQYDQELRRTAQLDDDTRAVVAAILVVGQQVARLVTERPS